MTGLEDGLVGALAVSAGYVLVLSCKKGWAMLERIAVALEANKTASDYVVKKLSILSVPVEGIWKELAYMRALSQGQEPATATGAIPNGPETPSRSPQAPYPGPAWDRYAVVPDAEPADTSREGLTQTDEELVDMERVENLRDRGIQVEDADAVHPGVEIESE